MTDPAEDVANALDALVLSLEPQILQLQQDVKASADELAALRRALLRTNERFPKQFARQYRQWELESRRFETLTKNLQESQACERQSRLRAKLLRQPLRELSDHIATLKTRLAALCRADDDDVFARQTTRASLEEAKAVHRWRRNPANYSCPFTVPEKPCLTKVKTTRREP